MLLIKNVAYASTHSHSSRRSMYRMIGIFSLVPTNAWNSTHYILYTNRGHS